MPKSALIVSGFSLQVIKGQNQEGKYPYRKQAFWISNDIGNYTYTKTISNEFPNWNGVKVLTFDDIHYRAKACFYGLWSSIQLRYVHGQCFIFRKTQNKTTWNSVIQVIVKGCIKVVSNILQHPVTFQKCIDQHYKKLYCYNCYVRHIDIWKNLLHVDSIMQLTKLWILFAQYLQK